MVWLCSYRVKFCHFKHPQKAILMSFSLCGLNFFFCPKPNTYHPICCAQLFLLNRNWCFHVHLWWMIPHPPLLPPQWTKSISSAEQRFLKEPHAQMHVRFLQMPPKQWLHSWQIPLILNLIRHWTVAYSVISVLASQPLCFLSSFPLSLPNTGS